MGLARPVALMAQSDNSSITGTITDPSGAVVDRAEITVISELTGAEHKTISNRSGFYTIAGLAPGKYTVKVVAPNFHTATRTNNNLDPAVPATVNIALVVGATNQQVEITANETTLQADSSTLGRVITSSRQITCLSTDAIPFTLRSPKPASPALRATYLPSVSAPD